jgi:hypothetical protein
MIGVSVSTDCADPRRGIERPGTLPAGGPQLAAAPLWTGVTLDVGSDVALTG